MIKSLLKRILTGVVLASVVFVGVGLLLPSHYTVSRSLVIEAPPERIHDYLADLARWPVWAPWQNNDPSLEVTLGTISRGAGANQAWNGDSGDGELVLTRSDQGWGIAYDLTFDQGSRRAACTMLYAPAEDGTRVTWRMTGENGWNPFDRYLGLLMKPVLGPMFDEGLARLKLEAEKVPAPDEETAPADGQ